MINKRSSPARLSATPVQPHACLREGFGTARPGRSLQQWPCVPGCPFGKRNFLIEKSEEKQHKVHVNAYSLNKVFIIKQKQKQKKKKKN